MFVPKDYANKSDTLPHSVTFSIIHIDDIAKSKITKLEEWKRIKDPNNVGVDRLNKGKIISEIDVNADEANPQPAGNNSAVYKLTLKDDGDNYCFAYEYNDQLPFLRPPQSNGPIPIRLGGRLVVKQGTLIANGALLLTRDGCNYLGVTESVLVRNLNTNLIDKSIQILESPDL